jgi:hypothetical protein
MPKIENKVVVHFRDGRIVKGYTHNFNTNKETFHVADVENAHEITEVSTSLMKAVFFVKTFEGDKDHPHPEDFSMESLKNVPGLKIKVTFFDGEVMYGTTHGYSPQKNGFFIFPADKTINNERVFVIKDSTVAVDTWR